jgi:hypothetical protein
MVDRIACNRLLLAQSNCPRIGIGLVLCSITSTNCFKTRDLTNGKPLADWRCLLSLLA